jgi:hypothetical protein
MQGTNLRGVRETDPDRARAEDFDPGSRGAV